MDRRRAYGDLGWLAATGAANVVGELIGLKMFVLPVAALFWMVRLGRRLRRPGTAEAWGLKGAAWSRSSLACGVFAAVGIGALLLAPHGGSFPGWSRFGLLVVVYYPWALAQQVLLCAVLGRALGEVVPGSVVPLVAGVAFGGAHLPDLLLAGLTFVAGAVWVALYRYRRNLWVVAASHAVLGSLAYTLTLGRDPLAALLQTM